MNYQSFREIEIKTSYIMNVRMPLNKKAMFSDGTSEYRNPEEPECFEHVVIKFRTAKNNVDRVWIVCEGELVLMKKAASHGLFDYYEGALQLTDQVVSYYFQIESGSMICFYDSRGVVIEPTEHYYFRIAPGFSVPKWAKGAVMYQIFTDRFYNGDKSNDVETREYEYIADGTIKVEDWNKPPAIMGVREFYGGDLQGVLDKLDYLQDLGIEAIYFNPLFVSPSNHKYDIQDYDYIDPHFGKIVSDGGDVLEYWDKENRHASKYIQRVTNKANLEASNQLFIELVNEAHKRGIKVILDGVFNHCGSFNKWLDRERIYEGQEGYEKGAYISEDSPYRSFFRFHEPNNWPYNWSYDGWWGHDTLPKLNYEESDELCKYILDIAAKWVSPPFNADGWRLDVAADLGMTQEYNHYFWQEFRRVVKESNPQAIILAEHYGDPSSWLQGDQWDTIMNYDAFMEPLTWFLTGMEKHSDEFRGDLLGNIHHFKGAMQYHMNNMMAPSLHCSMNEISNHDHSRFLTRTNRIVGRVGSLGSDAASENVEKSVLKEAVVIQMTWPGAPTIYYGDEAGVCGFTDPDNRRTYPWGQEDLELIDFHKAMIAIRRKHSALRNGSFMFLKEDYNLLVYGRFNRIEQLVIAVNNNDYQICVEVDVWPIGIPEEPEVIMQQIMQTDQFGYSNESIDVLVQSGKVILDLDEKTAVVLYRNNDNILI
ncbi:glycoside hydrolase family 13 protein [Anaerosacchariphilus polymeriproducens]|uniref:Glycoside hydrolase family 13 protein n=1 Tax=Anaerosacchariphilus polymeriproducens TaxID=1812858 RepID=A0A371AY36_9FIRM|nr:glycoside hydrolase family 13 protein [Anaerosacchariphilus polymeriproducens]RDU24494.1 glycoside hydrolase family 13 protein [Anaerosacchariphilus polymeriproducens]